ncbi:putative DNA-binding transcriptional regulator AlpA [Arthrobacter sp. CAN_A6]|uniref:helix-turn-helix transcriptional regulator n=1 Tax=Arthrobacter sp. CAN_A6 TaxID=2787721 RepID=UPI0018C946C0
MKTNEKDPTGADAARDPLRILTAQEAAAILHCSPATLKGWRYKQLGPKFVRLGYRTIGYRPADLEDFINRPTD